MTDNMIARMARLAATTMEVRGGQSGDGHSELIAAADEIERLEREVARLVKANESWHTRVMQEKEIRAESEAQCAAMREALARLSNEVLGSMPLMEPLARREFGNTNYELLMRRAEEARAALSPDAGAKVLRAVKAATEVSDGINIPDFAPDEASLVITTTNGGIIDTTKIITAGVIRKLREALAALDGGRP